MKKCTNVYVLSYHKVADLSNYNLRIAPQRCCSHNPPTIRNPLIYFVNRYFLMSGGFQGKKLSHANTKSVSLWKPGICKLKIERSATLWYDRT